MRRSRRRRGYVGLVASAKRAGVELARAARARARRGDARARAQPGRASTSARSRQPEIAVAVLAELVAWRHDRGALASAAGGGGRPGLRDDGRRHPRHAVVRARGDEVLVLRGRVREQLRPRPGALSRLDLTGIRGRKGRRSASGSRAQAVRQRSQRTSWRASIRGRMTDSPVLEVEGLVKHFHVGSQLMRGGGMVHAVGGLSLKVLPRRAPRPRRRGARAPRSRGRQGMTPFTTRPELQGTFGMVASTHWLASAAGMAVLERGGNAFDAAVAAGLRAAGRRAAPERPGRRPARCCSGSGRRRAARPVRAGAGARGATIERLPRGSGSTSCRARASLAACVPGAFDGWLLLLARLRDAGARRRARRSRSATRATASRSCRGSPATIARVEPLLRRTGRVGRAVLPPAPAPGALSATAALAATVPAHRRRGRRAAPRGADRRARDALLPRVRRGGDRPLRPSRRSPAGAADAATTWRAGSDRRGAGRAATSAADRAQDRAVGPGAGVPAAARAARRARPAGSGIERASTSTR